MESGSQEELLALRGTYCELHRLRTERQQAGRLDDPRLSAPAIA